MNHDDRPTPIPEPKGPPLPQPKPESFAKTQPIRPPTAEDVIEIFGHFRQDLLGQIDQRDERILLAVKDIGTLIAEHYERETKRADEHARWITLLRERTHKLSNAQQELDLRLAEIEHKLGIPTVKKTTPAPALELEPELA